MPELNKLVKMNSFCMKGKTRASALICLHVWSRAEGIRPHPWPRIKGIREDKGIDEGSELLFLVKSTSMEEEMAFVKYAQGVVGW